ncbi:glycosyltransferase family 2 protein [Bacillus sp. FJAT-53711]|uniref:Glycosyltransferase family 2 protein n=1 Tax=Bacillus yunxiaonensis TaxID=3127665 RepID=A0ABU8FSD5_9BACI
MSKVSIVVPIYNTGEKLHKCIKSILSQTFKDFELILVNDGSTDKSLTICKKYQQQDKRITVINKKNEGSIPTRRKGVEAAKSKYVMFVDADDWIDAKAIETLYEEAVKNNVDITVCNMYRVLGNGILIKKKVESWYFHENKIYNEEEIKRDLVTAYFHGHPFPSSLCAKLYKRELLEESGKYLKKIRFLGDDLFYNMEILLKTRGLKVIGKPFYYYRYGGFTSKYQPYLFDDMVNGYLIQEEIIEEYYHNTTEKNYNGISIMLLNTFKACLLNVFNSNFNEFEIKNLIQFYISNNTVIKCVSNGGAIKFFPKEYLNAIRNKDTEYLYHLGESMYKRARIRKSLINILSKIC